MNTEADTTSPLENNTRKCSGQDNSRRGRRIRTWAGRLRGAVASVAIAAVIGVGGAGMLNTQEAASAGVTQHNYAILTAGTQTQSSSTPQNDKKSSDD